ncbi:response regulator [Pseudodesulfovibrio piezophilus]|uniref:Response regulator receiver protein n=1 Tax=Pseudodesulfovibrio piezophilus (strain DSM 21447 / JCM 15486 / C1TLV30) TaxID=1322246 RepID=M1WP08_PSEP2|nr:response regulator [Pseudodesulfovibrio piezophilus]CCH47929.1 Response regulator receiver protein [Pseudodesulfovibrio piezophilus C1TLV30]
MPATILLIDDESGFVDTMAKRLAKRGLAVSTAYGGEEGVAVLEDSGFMDVVILDVKMPGMNGIEVLKKIKSAYPLIEVIMLTGHATVESAIEGMKFGAFDYMLKPCEIEELLCKIDEAYQKKQSHEDKISEAKARHIVLRRGD